MPIDFPSSPTVGQQYAYAGVNYIYTATGVWAVASTGAAASASKITLQKFTASGTYTPTPGTQFAIVECIGGGGGGGVGTGAASTSYQGAGGGSGGYSRSVLSAAQIGVSQSITIGAGGIGGAGGPNVNGSPGGASSFGGLVVANGGAGGFYSNVGQVPLGGVGAAVGTGDIAIEGTPGGPGYYNAVNAGIIAEAGYGAPGPFGGGANVGAGVGTPVSPGKGYGSGGPGGSGHGAISSAASPGAAGVVIITEYNIAAGPQGPQGPQGPPGGLPAVGFRAHKNGVDQAIGAAANAKVTFGFEDYDVGNYYDTALSRWIPPAGIVHIDAHMWCGSGVPGSAGAHLYKNGVAYKSAWVGAANVSSAVGVQISADDTCTGTDYYELYIYLPVAGSVIGQAATAWWSGHVVSQVGPQGPPGPPGVASGGRVLIQSQMVGAAVASVAFVTGIDATYDEYELRFYNAKAAADVSLALQISLDGGATWKTDGSYYYAIRCVGGLGTAAEFQSSTATSILVFNAQGAAAGYAPAQGVVRFSVPTQAAPHVFRIDSSGHDVARGYAWNVASGGYAGTGYTSAFNAIRIITSSGNIAQGTFNLYGIKR